MADVFQSNEVRIIVVDDVADAANALAAALELDGYQVRTASDGDQALAVIEEFEPHCALLDIDLPGMNGRELASRLRQRFGDAMVIVAVTGWGRSDDRVTAAFKDFDHYLRKPFETSALHKFLPPLR